MYPDQSLYPSNSGPELTRRINRTLERAAQIEQSEGGTKRDWFAPIVADAEAGFGGPLNCFEIMKAYIEAGAAGVHFEDQLASEKKCGHMGGKVLIPNSAHLRNLNAARLAADVYGVPSIIVELGAMGYKFQFITLAGFHSVNFGMFELARKYKDRGMAAYSELQQAEFDAEKNGYTAVRHQREVGTGYFDLVTMAVAGKEIEGMRTIENLSDRVQDDRGRGDKIREVTEGHDGTWVAHPGLVSVAADAFSDVLGTKANQVDRQRPDVNPSAADLIQFPTGERTEVGLRHNINVTLGYLESWLRGTGKLIIFQN
ncbi:unnamed protein product [Rotaria sp. Silwood2]|nr:unnamed protein product [Rotaria sp. Silwood2]CAF4354325.1 unnamed protein product [Rotaria sp. Silwood2]